MTKKALVLGVLLLGAQGVFAHDDGDTPRKEPGTTHCGPVCMGSIDEKEDSFSARLSEWIPNTERATSAVTGIRNFVTDWDDLKIKKAAFAAAATGLMHRYKYVPNIEKAKKNFTWKKTGLAVSDIVTFVTFYKFAKPTWDNAVYPAASWIDEKTGALTSLKDLVC